MAVIKVFDSVGVKTVQLMGNLNEQDYDAVEVIEDFSVEPSGESEE